MKKFSLIFFPAFLFFLALGNIGVVKAESSSAHQDLMHTVFDNSLGTIPITVFFSFTKTNEIAGTEIQSGSRAVSVGSSVTINGEYFFNHDPAVEGTARYVMDWATSCYDPPVEGNVTEFDPLSGNFRWDFPTQDVHCMTPNGEPVITTGSCTGTTGSVSWLMTGPGPYNVANYALFRSESPDTNPDDNFIQNVSASQTSISWPGLNPGSTYYVRVSAVSPQGQYSAPSYFNFFCPAAPPTPTPTPVASPTPTPVAIPSPSPSPVGGWWVDITAVCDLSVSTTVNWTVSATAPLGSNSLIIVKKDGAEIGRTGSLNISGSQVSGSGTYSAEIYDNSGFGPLMFSDSQSITCGVVPPPPTPTPGASPSPVSGPSCGDWILDPSEACDDGNTISGDGCSATCGIEVVVGITPPPTNLTLNGVPVTCTDIPYNVTFSWSGSTALILYVSKDNFLSTVGYATVLGSNSISSTSFSPPLVLEPGETYQWRIFYGQPGGTNGFAYGPSFRADLCGSACETRSSGLVENIGGGFNLAFDWVNPDGVKVSDGSYAYSAAILSGTFARTSTLKLTDFGFNIPAANWVYGIKVDVAGFSIPTAPLSFIVYSFVSPTGNLVVNGSATGYFRGGGLFPDRPPAQYVVMGGNNDDWGTNLRGSDVNRADFGVAVYDNLSGKGAVYGYIDHVRVTICHTAPKLPPTPPVNLQASAICLPGRIPQVNFTWEDTSGNEDGYWLDVNNSPWTGDAAPSPWGVKKLAKNATSFMWNQLANANILDSGTPQIPENGNRTYYWRMKAFNKGYESVYAYPPNTAAPPGVSVFVPDCMEDLDFNDVESDLQFYSDSTYTTTKQAFNPGELMYAQVKVKNTGADITGPFNVGFYLDRVSVPSCGESAIITTVNGLARNQVSAPWRFTVNAPLNPGYKVAVAFADRDCAISESDENNNIRGRVYSVSAPGWFETTAGDVGAGGSIVSGAPYCPSPPGNCSYSTDYLLAGDSLSSCSTKKWKIDSYANPPYPQTSSGVYDYLASRFLAKATNSACSLSALSSTVFNLCDTDVTLSAFSPWPISGSNFVWFINGNLTVETNFTVPADKTIVFVVRGNITVNTTVSRADGIYVAGGEFNDTNSAGGTVGPQLVIDGAVYASTINLPRRLAANNDTTPSDVVNFQPKYIEAFNDILGVPAISWQEVAP